MSRTVHGFQGKGLLLCLKREHVLAVVLPMSRCLPQLAVVDVRCHHFLETPLSVLTLTKTEQSYHNLSFAELPQAKQSTLPKAQYTAQLKTTDKTSELTDHIAYLLYNMEGKP